MPDSGCFGRKNACFRQSLKGRDELGMACVAVANMPLIYGGKVGRRLATLQVAILSIKTARLSLRLVGCSHSLDLWSE